MNDDFLNINNEIPTFNVEEWFDLLSKLDDNKPSKKIVNSKKGLNAIKTLIDLKNNHNVSWYQYLFDRNKGNLDNLALFYRGNKITYRQMFENADLVAKSMYDKGIVKGDEIGVCVSNTPELVYILLAANKLGAKVNIFGPQFKKEYLSEIFASLTDKMVFISDDNYSQVEEIVEKRNFKNIVVSSLSDSLPKDYTKCDEYEKDLDRYYHFENKVPLILNKISNGESFKDFLNEGKYVNGDIPNEGDLETDFLVTYTSGSTKIGFPSALVHKNRSLNVMGRFHDSDVSGNPTISGLRGLALVHPESNTGVITSISDSLMQGWSLALEPEYDLKNSLDYLFLNKPTCSIMSTSFFIEAAKQYLVDNKHNENGKMKKLPFLFAPFAAGEAAQIGEEKFINQFLRKARAGSGVSINGLRMPFVTLSVGGGDCEHGGIYYTLWKSLSQKKYSFALKGKELGLLPVPYVVVTALKKDKNGNFVECNYDENGLIVANSYSNLSRIKNDVNKTKSLIVEDNLGRKWITCKTYGYIDRVGGVHVKGRVPEKECSLYPFELDDIITKDSKNILSCATVNVGDDYVSTLQFQPFKKDSDTKVLSSLYNRVSSKLNSDILDKIFIRILPVDKSYPLTAAGKRSSKLLEMMGYDMTIKLSDFKEFVDNKNKLENEHRLIKKLH